MAIKVDGRRRLTKHPLSKNKEGKIFHYESFKRQNIEAIRKRITLTLETRNLLSVLKSIRNLGVEVIIHILP